VGYEFLFFGYSKNATLGYFNLDDNNPTKKPLVVVNPVVVAPAGTTYGGYFSPEQFFLNSFRLDLQGSFLKKYIEYKLGGSIGVQTVTQGHGINEPNHTSFASSFDGNVIFNHTDWFATYINGDYIQGGGFFNRWRFGGGVIFRPDIPALSPIVKR
jgi:hypothetical protein